MTRGSCDCVCWEEGGAVERDFAAYGMLYFMLLHVAAD